MNPRASSILRITGVLAVAALVSACGGEEKRRPPQNTNPGSTSSTGEGGAGGSGGEGGSGGAPSASCSNEVKDGGETDTDCGGSCSPCTDGFGCEVGADCQSQSCVNNVCLPPSCTDGVKNGIETDTDCGGLCAACAAGSGCAEDGDCVDLVCLSNVCLPPSCTDGVKNGTESDIDCGSACNTKCPPGQKCSTNDDCTTESCNSATKLCTCPASMVIAPAIGGGSYCIDSFEVTQAEYDVFLQANPNLAGLPSICAGNIYQPSGNWPYSDDGRYPVRNIDWCDAYAYCKYSEKHLCGKIGGGMNPTGEYADATQSEWFNACTGQGVSDYPYGEDFISGKCAGESMGTLLQKVMQSPYPNCEGGGSGLYHMSGNVAEWEDSCDAAGQCLVRGGSLQSSATDLRCDASAFRAALDNTDPYVGFRCCL